MQLPLGCIWTRDDPFVIDWFFCVCLWTALILKTSQALCWSTWAWSSARPFEQAQDSFPDRKVCRPYWMLLRVKSLGLESCISTFFPCHFFIPAVAALASFHQLEPDSNSQKAPRGLGLGYEQGSQQFIGGNCRLVGHLLWPLWRNLFFFPSQLIFFSIVVLLHKTEGRLAKNQAGAEWMVPMNAAFFYLLVHVAFPLSSFF